MGFTIPGVIISLGLQGCAFIFDKYIDLFPESTIKHLARFISDHRLLLIIISDTYIRGTDIF